MRYFVIGDDGQKYGPADVPTLQQWIAEGRLLPTQQVEEEGSGIRMAAKAVQGLNFPLEPQQPSAPQSSPYAQAPGAPQAGPYAQPQPGAPAQGYPRQSQYVGDDGKNDVTLAWVLGVLGFFCCCCGIAGIVFAYRAQKKGHPGAQAAIIGCWIFLALELLLGGVRGMTVYNQMKNGTYPGVQRSVR